MSETKSKPARRDYKAELKDMTEEYQGAVDDVVSLMQAIRRMHGDSHTAAFQWCTDGLCATAVEIGEEYAW